MHLRGIQLYIIPILLADLFAQLYGIRKVFILITKLKGETNWSTPNKPGTKTVLLQQIHLLF